MYLVSPTAGPEQGLWEHFMAPFIQWLGTFITNHISWMLKYESDLGCASQRNSLILYRFQSNSFKGVHMGHICCLDAYPLPDPLWCRFHTTCVCPSHHASPSPLYWKGCQYDDWLSNQQAQWTFFSYHLSMGPLSCITTDLWLLTELF